MKYLIVILFTFFTIDTFAQIDFNILKQTIIANSDSGKTYSTGYIGSIKHFAYDTVQAILLITPKAPGFAKAVRGYCIMQGAWCTGVHTDCRYNVVKYPTIVWQCVRIKNLFKK